MPSDTKAKASKTNAYDNYRWVSGKNARFDAVCIRVDPASGRVALGVKGWDARHKAPGFVIVDLAAIALQDIATLCTAAIPVALGELAKQAKPQLVPAAQAAPVAAQMHCANCGLPVAPRRITCPYCGRNPHKEACE